MELRVTLTGHEQWATQATCRDIGIGGMFVETNTNVLEPDATLQVSFKLGQGAAQTHHRLPARVVHLAEHGAGLIFSEFPLDTLRALSELLYEDAGV